MQTHSGKITNFLPSIHTDTYCAYKSILNRKVWRAEHQRANYSRLYFILEGACTITINDVDYTASKHQLILIPANSEYSFSIPGDSSMTKLWCHFNAMIGETSLFDLIRCDYRISYLDSAKMIMLFNKLIDTFPLADPIISQLQQQAILSEILTEFLLAGSYELSSHMNEHKLHLDRVITYMETHLNEKMSITELAALVHMNANYFIQVFTKTYGISPLKKLNQIKLKKIMEILERTSAPISEIASQMGFDDISYFSKFTKKYLGFSPREYRIYKQYKADMPG